MLAVTLIVAGVYFLSALPLFSQGNLIPSDGISLTSASAEDAKYIASVNSEKFHRPSCRYVDDIYDENRIYYSRRGDALSDGKSPCSACDP